MPHAPILSSCPPDAGPHSWPRPPSCLTAQHLVVPPNGARVAVAGLVILRQRPGTAKGVIFLTLEDETGVVNIVVWRKLYERFRRAVIAGRMLRVTGRIQRENSVTHVLADHIEDISPLLDQLLTQEADGDHRPDDSGPSAKAPRVTAPTAQPEQMHRTGRADRADRAAHRSGTSMLPSGQQNG